MKKYAMLLGCLLLAVGPVPQPAGAEVRTGETIDSPEELADALADGGRALVIGRVRWIQNGKPQKLGTGLFTNMITLHVYRQGSDHRIRGNHAEDGTYAWAMPPGTYHIPLIAFLTKEGNSVMAPAFFRFEVLEADGVTYLGTLEVNSTRKSGFPGWKYKMKELVVKDECAADCELVLARIGLDGATTRQAPMEPDVAMLERWSETQKKDDD
jgi:hypothetical protein